MGSVSKELCGGTHTAATGQIGLFHIISESSISAGVRRIEAITGMNSLKLLREKEAVVAEAASELKMSERGVPQRISELLKENDSLKKTLALVSQEKVADRVKGILEGMQKSDGAISFVTQTLGAVDKEAFTAIADAISDRLKTPPLQNGVVVIGALVDSKAQLFAAAGQTAVQKGGVHCGTLIKEAAIKAGGSGGGSPMRAQAGCKDAGKLSEALEAALSILKKKAGA
jgi:alanyl-tRNA synthetase